MSLEEAGFETTHLIHSRDTKFTRTSNRLMGSADIHILKTPVVAPNANTFV